MTTLQGQAARRRGWPGPLQDLMTSPAPPGPAVGPGPGSPRISGRPLRDHTTRHEGETRGRLIRHIGGRVGRTLPAGSLFGRPIADGLDGMGGGGAGRACVCLTLPGGLRVTGAVALLVEPTRATSALAGARPTGCSAYPSRSATTSRTRSHRPE